MFLGVDDTDSPRGMCTTYLMTKIIEEIDLDLIGYPSLVRLNPNVPYCTRGNASLAIRLGKGRGRPNVIGAIGEKPIITYPGGEEAGNMEEVLELGSSIVRRYMEHDSMTNPGIVVSRGMLPAELYDRAVKSFVEQSDVETLLQQKSALYEKIGNGRGIIGAAAAISWPALRVTFELISYGFPFRENGKSLKEEISSSVHRMGTTFDSFDPENRRAAMFPSSRTPIIYGIRGSSPSDLIRVRESIPNRALGEERYMLYRTNQASDDHIIRDPESLKNGESYRVEGFLLDPPAPMEGGHYFADLGTRNGNLKIAAFEPTKAFRASFRQLLPGDYVRVYGSYLDGSMHLEKFALLARGRSFVRTPPKCGRCGKRMKNRGYMDYRCINCGAHASSAEYTEEKRSINCGIYEVPTCARRHLSRPISLIGDGGELF